MKQHHRRPDEYTGKHHEWHVQGVNGTQPPPGANPRGVISTDALRRLLEPCGCGCLVGIAALLVAVGKVLRVW